MLNGQILVILFSTLIDLLLSYSVFLDMVICLSQTDKRTIKTSFIIKIPLSILNFN